jgi:hypothetical protein
MVIGSVAGRCGEIFEFKRHCEIEAMSLSGPSSWRFHEAFQNALRTISCRPSARCNGENLPGSRQVPLWVLPATSQIMIWWRGGDASFVMNYGRLRSSQADRGELTDLAADLPACRA